MYAGEIRRVLSAVLYAGHVRAHHLLADACTRALVTLRDGGTPLADIVLKASTFFEERNAMPQPRRYDHDTRVIYSDRNGLLHGALVLVWYRAEPGAPGEPMAGLVYAEGQRPNEPKAPRVEPAVPHRSVAGSGPYWVWPDELGEMGNDGSLALPNGSSRSAVFDRPPPGLHDGGTPSPVPTSRP